MDNAGAATAPGVELWVCPFLRAPDARGALGAPVGWPDPSNRCVALGDAAPQSLRQQEYACLASAHVDCPRFIRGVQVVTETPPVPVRTGLPVTPAIIAALLVLAGSFALSIGFVVANGGMDLEAAASTNPGASLPATAPSPAPSEAQAVGSDPPPASPEASAEPSPSASIDAATTKPSATASATPSPAVEPTPRPSSDRLALLSPCPDAADCWIYVIRTGDNLVSIARYFGAPLDEVTRLNPWTRTTQLVAGQELRLPPPTR
jgi:hypothetical protein